MKEVQVTGEGNTEELYKKIVIRCPKCGTQKSLQIPSTIILKSRHITVVSIPQGITCDHYYQAYIDKNFDIRGYQLVDFKITNMEYYESSGTEEEYEEEADASKFVSLPLFQDIINLLRDTVDDIEIIGSAIFTVEGIVLYSSIPHSALFNTLKEFEVRNEKGVHGIIKMFLELKNNQKVCSEYVDILGNDFILVLVFAKEVNLAIGAMNMRNLIKKIKNLIE